VTNESTALAQPESSRREALSNAKHRRTELVIVAVIARPTLGPTRLPAAGRSLGQGIREFKDLIPECDRPGTDDVALAAAPIADDAQAPTGR